ncbi:MAG: TadE/TadG family type IV pilus assembly protein [Kiritimatiellia bacterium]|nr:TadE/TadG family type IV pilus assembly protein [Kiritimatiellia bacterium]MDP6809802.1 TadE/TadG family type IV pilus assembly protein [Kiritimatiellia bacterium]MDP7025088.1 TadE/TadG family type IV pilus assembly protein [Kiritimatiellia bacterium]
MLTRVVVEVLHKAEAVTGPPRVVPSRRQGASLIEACLALMIICLIFLGMFQVSRALAARDTLSHSAARVARARTVGFNQWMVRKVSRVAAIPNVGQMLEPLYVNENPALQAAVAEESPGTLWDWVVSGQLWPSFTQAQLEIARIPLYLGAANWAQAEFILDYENWDSIEILDDGDPSDTLLNISVGQNYPLTVPGSGSFYADGNVPLVGESIIENHYTLYLEDQGW